MFPTLPAQHHRWTAWANPPNMTYSFKHHFAWPVAPEAAATAAAAGAGAGAPGAAATPATEAAAAGLGRMAAYGGGGMPPHVPPHYYHGYGRGYGWGGGRWGRGGGGMRKLVWFGLGAGLTAWYFKSRERHRGREHERQLLDDGHFPSSHCGWNRAQGQNSAPAQAQALPNMPPPAFPSQAHRVDFPAPTRFDTYAPPSAPTQAQSANAAAAAAAQTMSQTAAPATSAPTATPTAAPRAPEPSPIIAETKSTWGWRARRAEWRDRLAKAEAERDRLREEVQARAEADKAASATNSTATPTTDPTPFSHADHMAAVQAEVQRLWGETKLGAAEAQERANEAAKAYTRDKLDRLSAALDSLRESLKQDAHSKSTPTPDRKLV